MTIRVCVAGVTGWTGSMVAKAILGSGEFELVGAVARKSAGQDVGQTLGLESTGVQIAPSLEEIIKSKIDVLIDYTKPDSVKKRTLLALDHGIRVVIGTSGLGSEDFAEIEKVALSQSLGVVAAGNFSITAALAKHFALSAAKNLPASALWEVIDYAHADKADAPSGTTRELAEELSRIRSQRVAHPIENTHGFPEARGARIGGTQVHSLRLPSYVIAFESIFGLPNERLTIRHDAGSGAEPYVAGTLLAVRKVMSTQGLIRGLDRLLFSDADGSGQ